MTVEWTQEDRDTVAPVIFGEEVDEEERDTVVDAVLEVLGPLVEGRVRAAKVQTLRDAAGTDDPDFHIEVTLGGSDYVRSWLRDRADQLERGTS